MLLDNVKLQLQARFDVRDKLKQVLVQYIEMSTRTSAVLPSAKRAEYYHNPCPPPDILCYAAEATFVAIA